MNWTIEVIGGFSIFYINKAFNGDIEPLNPHESETISTGRLFGFGPVKITATARIGGEPVHSETMKARVLFFYMFTVS